MKYAVDRILLGKAAEFLDKLTHYQLLKKDSAPWSWFVDVYVNIYRNKQAWPIMRLGIPLC
jgi:hypothetical protein